MEPVRLDDRAIIALSGPEARDFLQNLVTNDVMTLAPGKALYAALLSPQGKIAFDFLLTEGEGALLIDCAASSAELLLKRLRLYRLRAKVEIALRPQLGVYLDLNIHPGNRPVSFAARAVTFSDPRLGALGRRSIGAIAEMPGNLKGSRLYHDNRLALGVPEAADFGIEKIFAMDAGLDELHAISFTKGCYIGQELTSRMKHRASARKRIWSLTAQAPIPSGARVLERSVEIGEVISTYGSVGFALVRLDRICAPMDQVFVDQIPVALHKPRWLA